MLDPQEASSLMIVYALPHATLLVVEFAALNHIFLQSSIGIAVARFHELEWVAVPASWHQQNVGEWNTVNSSGI